MSTHLDLHYHFIFSTKNRLPQIVAEIKSSLHQYIGGIIRELGGHPECIGGVEDHIHILCRWKANRAISDLLRIIKSNSSKWVHEKYPQYLAFEWQAGYGAFTVSRSNTAAVRRYIDNQEEHHKKCSFQQEYLSFLELHEVEYKEEYLWV